ncbi:MAG TPA: hypothetical protein VLB07_12560 [Woeseiaceae bacterium]|nr:hypothetical protein [Woeseiaceae bacterium]
MKPVTAIALAAAALCSGIALIACAPASLGSAPASERTLQCRSHETRVCRTRNPGRLGTGDEEPEYDFCTCETLNDGLPL